MSPEEIRSTVGSVVRALDWADLDLVVVFGSAASGRLTPRSDVDVFMRLAPGLSLSYERRVQLEGLLTSALRREVDVVIDSPSTSVVLRRQVAAKGIAVHERSRDAFKRFVVDAIRAYVDLEPQLRFFAHASRQRAIREGRAALDALTSRDGR